MAVIANGLVIGISSDFIPRLVYRYHYGPCAVSNSTNLEWVSELQVIRPNKLTTFFSIGKNCLFIFKHTWWTFILSVSCMTGYINNTLATAFMSNEAVRRDFKELITDNGYNITQCRCDFLPLHLIIKRMNLIGWFILYGLIRTCFLWYSVITLNVYCVSYSYKDYRSDEDQSLTSQFWLILALRFAFVILFEVQMLILFRFYYTSC